MGFEEILRQIAFTCVRFMAFCAHAILLGAPAVMLLVLRPSFAGLDREEWNDGRLRLAARLDGVVHSSFIASAIATAVAIALQATLVAEFNEGDLSSPSFLSVFSTTFGQWHLFRYPLLAGLIVLLSGKVRQWSLQLDGGAARSWWIGWLGLLGWPAGDEQLHRPRRGCISPLAWSLERHHAPRVRIYLVRRDRHPCGACCRTRGGQRTIATSLQLLAPVVVRFSKVALVSITIVAITGTLNSLMNVAELDDMYTEAYGISLTLKIGLFLGVLALGGVNHFFLRERMRRGLEQGTSTSAQRLFRMTIAVELVIALSIMGMTGWLVGQAKTKQATVVPDSAGQLGLDTLSTHPPSAPIRRARPRATTTVVPVGMSVGGTRSIPAMGPSPPPFVLPPRLWSPCFPPPCFPPPAWGPFFL